MNFIAKLNKLVRPHKVKEIVEEVDGAPVCMRFLVSHLAHFLLHYMRGKEIIHIQKQYK